MAEQTYSSEQYQTHFDPTTYLNMYYNTTPSSQSLNDFRQFPLEAHHNFWSNVFQPCLSSTTGEIRCLEFGGGPSISSLISAAAKVDRIVFAEYLEANRQAVLSWIAGDVEAYNWKPFIEHVVGDLEGDKSVEALLKRQEELKKKIKSVVPCDVYKSPIVGLEDFDVGKPFDVISTSFCMECTTNSEAHYKRVVTELCQLLKPSGYLQIIGSLEESWYCVGTEKFHTVPVTKNALERAMKEAELQDIKIEVVKDQEADVLYNQQFMCHAIGRKLGKL